MKIDDTTKLRITKIKNWAIYFTYDNEKYLLHESSEDYETATTLYKREVVNEHGKFKLIPLKSGYGGQIPNIKYKTNNRIKNYNSRPFSQIDMNNFVWDMTWKGYFSSCYDIEIEKTKQKIKDIETTIETLKDMMRELRNK